MKSIFTCIFTICVVSSSMAIREDYAVDIRPSVFEGRERAWQGLRETKKREMEEAARIANRQKQNKIIHKPAANQKIN